MDIAERTPVVATSTEALDFAAVYKAHHAFVWRTLRRFGVPQQCVEDAAQKVFMTVHRRLSEFEGRSSVKTWLFGIVLNVARQDRRTRMRHDVFTEMGERELPTATQGPHDALARTEAAQLVYALLDNMDEVKREVFVMADLEQMTGAEIALVLNIPMNTVYSRLRVARIEFEEGLARYRQKQGGGAR